MNIKACHPAQLAEDLLDRSICAVQVAAVLSDNNGIFGWGWNSAGAGFGMHAEEHVLRRSNPKRWKRGMKTGVKLHVAARRRNSGNTVTAKPCEECQQLLRGVTARRGRIFYRDGEGNWTELLM